MASKKDNALVTLAEKLESWGARHRASRDPYLTQLANALRDKRNLHIFAILDPMQYLPMIEARINDSLLRRVRIITVIRNTLVFAPVALTWAAVNVSTTAFAKYTQENPNGVANFLDFWQNGYNYLPGHWKIASVAGLDFIIILIVIVFTIYVSVIGQRISDKRERDQAVIDGERTALALEIALILDDKKKITTANFNQALAGSASRLVNATHDLEKAARAIAKVNRG